MAINAKVMTQYLEGKVIEFTDFLDPNNENDSGSLVLAFTDNTLLRIDAAYDYSFNIQDEPIAYVERVEPGVYVICNSKGDVICDFGCNDREVRVFDGTWNLK